MAGLMIVVQDNVICMMIGRKAIEVGSIVGLTTGRWATQDGDMIQIVMRTPGEGTKEAMTSEDRMN